MTRRELGAWTLLWTLIATAVAVGIVAGFLVLSALDPGAALAASRPAAIPTSTASRDLSGPAAASGSPLAGVSQSAAGAPYGPASPSPSPVATATPGRGLTPGRTPIPSARVTRTVRGIASTYGPAFGPGWLALPEGVGVRVRVCGPAACIVRTSNDAEPDLAMQRAGRIADDRGLAALTEVLHELHSWDAFSEQSEAADILGDRAVFWPTGTDEYRELIRQYQAEIARLRKIETAAEATVAAANSVIFADRLILNTSEMERALSVLDEVSDALGAALHPIPKADIPLDAEELHPNAPWNAGGEA
jgi:hypothetical protein